MVYRVVRKSSAVTDPVTWREIAEETAETVGGIEEASSQGEVFEIISSTCVASFCAMFAAFLGFAVAHEARFSARGKGVFLVSRGSDGLSSNPGGVDAPGHVLATAYPHGPLG